MLQGLAAYLGSTGPSVSVQRGERKGPVGVTSRSFVSGIGCEIPQRSRYYADQPIRWPNS